MKQHRAGGFLWIVALLAAFFGAWLGQKALADSSYGYVISEILAAEGEQFYILHESDERFLTREEISDLTLQELCYARNEIYARHGRIFDSPELAGYFSHQDWYQGSIPFEDFSMEELTGVERANADLLAGREDELGGYVLDTENYSYEAVRSFGSLGADRPADGDYLFADSDARYLTEAELAGLSLQTLCYARSEIYARHGYIFNAQELLDYFSGKAWYQPSTPAAAFDPEVFNTYEAANVALLKQVEYSISPNGYQLY